MCRRAQRHTRGHGAALNSRPLDVAAAGASSLIGEALRRELRTRTAHRSHPCVLGRPRVRARGRRRGGRRGGLCQAAGGFRFRPRAHRLLLRPQQARALAPAAAGQTLAGPLRRLSRVTRGAAGGGADANPGQLALIGRRGRPHPQGPDRAPRQRRGLALATALAPLHAAARLVRADVATYHSVSGAGRGARGTGAREAAALLNGQEPRLRAGATAPALHVLPWWTRSSRRVDTSRSCACNQRSCDCWRPRELVVNATAVRVPVFFGHAMAAHLQFECDLDPAEALRLLQQAPGVSVGSWGSGIRVRHAGRGARGRPGPRRAGAARWHATCVAESVDRGRQCSKVCCN